MPEASTAFVMPKRPQDAVIFFTITVEPGQDCEFTMSGALTPGDVHYPHDAVEDLFIVAQVKPRFGIYVFEMSASGHLLRLMAAPEGALADEVRRISVNLVGKMTQLSSDLVQALQAFPTQEVITQAARQMVTQIFIASICDSSSEWISVDPWTVPVERVKCVRCAFGVRAVFVRVLADTLGGSVEVDDRPTQIGNLEFLLVNHEGKMGVLVGYLSHDSDFATFLNGVLADRVREAIQIVTTESASESAIGDSASSTEG